MRGRDRRPRVAGIHPLDSEAADDPLGTRPECPVEDAGRSYVGADDLDPGRRLVRGGKPDDGGHPVATLGREPNGPAAATARRPQDK